MALVPGGEMNVPDERGLKRQHRSGGSRARHRLAPAYAWGQRRDERPRREGIETPRTDARTRIRTRRRGEMNVPDERGLKRCRECLPRPVPSEAR